MSEPHDDHQQHIVLDGVDDAIIADPDSKTGPTLESPCTWRARIPGDEHIRVSEASRRAIGQYLRAS